jgi:phage/plasmid-like protein (TIGR03299 family)
MAHNINLRRGKHSFASKTEIAWHGLGQIVDSMTSAEAIKLGGLDFEVGLAPLYAQVEGNLAFEDVKQFPDILRTRENEEGYVSKYSKVKPVKTGYATYRKDDQHIFGIVGNKYEVYQNTEAFEFFDDIIGQGHAKYETVGALGNGETIFITAKLPSKLIVNKEDIDKYLLLTSTHDGTGSIKAMFTPIRVVCNNTLSAALERNYSNKLTVKHTKNAKARMRAGAELLGIIKNSSEKLEELYNIMARTPIADPVAYDILSEVFGIQISEVEGENKLSKRASNKLENIKKYYHEGIGQKEIEGTTWGVFNAVTGYCQNVEKKKDVEKLFKDSFMGRDDLLRNKALALLTNNQL